MKFDAFMSSYEFGYIIPELQKSGFLKSLTLENKARKTASFYGEKFNVLWTSVIKKGELDNEIIKSK